MVVAVAFVAVAVVVLVVRGRAVVRDGAAEVLGAEEVEAVGVSGGHGWGGVVYQERERRRSVDNSRRNS
jgi:hypothetical protein